jgi:hypothetical protein
MTTEPHNSEEPSPDAMDRLWAALDASLDPPPPPVGTVGALECLRCGWRWDPRLPTVPRCCPNPLCHSTYWDRPPQRARARRPESTDLDEVRAQLARDRGTALKLRKLQKVRRVAREVGLELVDDRPRNRRGSSNAPKMTILPASQAPVAGIAELRREAAARDRATVTPPANAFRPTVPPPPGLDDLDSDTKG